MYIPPHPSRPISGQKTLQNPLRARLIVGKFGGAFSLLLFRPNRLQRRSGKIARHPLHQLSAHEREQISPFPFYQCGRRRRANKMFSCYIALALADKIPQL